MRRSAVWSLLAVLVLFVSALTACGGGNGSSTSGVPAKIVVIPSTVSIELGHFVTLNVIVEDASGSFISTPPTVTYSSSNTGVATVTSSGAVCGGTWDSSHIVCTPGPVGSATITITSGSASTTVPVAVHAHIDRLVVNPPSVNCKSQKQTAQITAQALSNGTDITSTIGPITWASSATNVATVDSNGVVTAVAPGVTSITASVASINSLPASFTTCPAATISVHLPNVTDTSFTLAGTATQQLAVDVLDSTGATIDPTNISLTWATSQAAAATISSSGLLTAVAPGTTSITAACIRNCNFGLQPVYSNVVTETTTGTSTTTVYAAGTGSTLVTPIDTTTNAAGTGITLPAQPNSLLINVQGTIAYLGSSAGLLSVTTSSGTVANDTAHPGTVLAISPDGTWVVVAGASSVFLVNTSAASSSQTVNIAGATAAAFAPDSSKVFIVAGSTLWSVLPGGASAPITEPAALSSATVLASGAFAYFGSAANNVFALASCNNGPADTPLPTTSAPSLLATLPDGKAVLAVDSQDINAITVTSSLTGCPPPLADAIFSANFGQGTFTPRQLIVLPNGSRAYVTSSLGGLLVYDMTTGGPAGGAASFLPLAGVTSTFTGGATLDSTRIYVGSSDSAVHLINVATGSDTRIPLPYTPDLVAVRPK